MLKYICKRLVYLVFVFMIISMIMFGVYKAVPGDPAAMMMEGSKLSMDPVQYEEQYEFWVDKLGLDQPVVVQYFKWFFNVLQGEFGFSIQHRLPVVDLITDPLKNTIMLNIPSIFLVLVITIPLGIATAVRKGSVFDNTVQIGSVVGYSMPLFIVALLCIFLFAVKLPWFPISGVNSAGFQGTDTERFLDMLHHMALPMLVIVISSLGSVTRYVRAAMIGVLQNDYIRTARAKGLREKVVIYSHAFRNALIPIVTILTGWILSIFQGSIVIESIFLWKGIGKMMIDGLLNRDFMVVLAMQLFYVILALLGNLIMDLCYCLVDPRVKLGD